jgi:hypothetical protein
MEGHDSVDLLNRLRIIGNKEKLISAFQNSVRSLSLETTVILIDLCKQFGKEDFLKVVLQVCFFFVLFMERIWKEDFKRCFTGVCAFYSFVCCLFCLLLFLSVVDLLMSLCILFCIMCDYFLLLFFLFC